MRSLILLCACIFALTSTTHAFFGPSGGSAEHKRANVRKDRDAIIAKVAETNPSVKENIKKAAGYATFNNKNVYLLMVATGHGFGMVVDNQTGKEIFMRMGSVGGGAGMGARDLRVLFIFNSADAMERFIKEGIQVGGEAEAAAKSGEQGTSLQQGGGVDTQGLMTETYQITEAGVAAQATVSGTKYWKDDELN